MGFRAGSYAKIWKVEPSENGKTTKIQFSISKKNTATNTYETDFSDYAILIGSANETARKNNLKSGDRIKLGEVDVGNSYNKETRQTRYFFRIYAYSPAENSSQTDYPFEGEPIIESVQTVESNSDEAPF